MAPRGRLRSEHGAQPQSRRQDPQSEGIPMVEMLEQPRGTRVIVHPARRKKICIHGRDVRGVWTIQGPVPLRRK